MSVVSVALTLTRVARALRTRALTSSGNGRVACSVAVEPEQFEGHDDRWPAEGCRWSWDFGGDDVVGDLDVLAALPV